MGNAIIDKISSSWALPLTCLGMITTLLNNRYQILESLGRGGFGETFLSTDTHMPSGRKCVIKQLKPAVQSPEIPEWLKERFQREAVILEELGENHAQIPRLYAYFVQDGNFYLVQEWIEGLTLTQKHKQQGNLSEPEVREILVNILPVLDYIHSRRIIHRDVKPDNIIIRAADGLPVLIDFGVMKEAMATAVNPDGKSAYSVALGTPGYMASEQAAGRPVYSSDLYSLGLTAVFLLTGKTPQYLETDARSGEILWRKEASRLHSNLASAINRAIRFHPRDRFSSAREMLRALEPASQAHTEATLAIAPGRSGAEKVLQRQPQGKASPTPVMVPDTEADGDEGWFIPALVVGGITLATFGLGFLGFLIFTSKNITAPSPTPTPSTIIESPAPETFPPVEPAQSKVKPRDKPSPEVELTPTPEATVSPEVELTPTPEATVSPEVELTPTPQPSVSAAPDPPASSTPIPEPSATNIPVIPPPSSNSETRDSAENKSSSLPVPVIRTGTPDNKIRQKLGAPTSVNSGLWKNSRAVLYKNVIPGQVDLGYLFDVDTGTVKQTEASFAQAAGLPTLKKTVNNFLGGKTPASVQQGLEQIYHRQNHQYSFVVGNLKGTIQRNSSDRIYIGVWEADFH